MLSELHVLRTNVHLQAMCTNSAAFSRISELPTVLPADSAAFSAQILQNCD
jgi:hypothetical protein